MFAKDDNSSIVCTCTDNRLYWICPNCGKHFTDEVDSVLCCMDDDGIIKKKGQVENG
jgi:transposase-like protein